MEYHSTQKIVAADKHPYRVVCCGRQWGKTTLACYEMQACAYAKSGRKIVYFATTFDQARNIAWAELKKINHGLLAKEPNESRLELTIKCADGGTSEISLRGFEAVETARGQQFDLIVVDECAFMKNFDYAWSAILEPTLAFRHGEALFISTPQGHNFFEQMYLKGQVDNDLWKSWRFTSYDNPHLDIERIEQAKANSSEDFFQQEYMADFRTYTGLAHKSWSREVNLIPAFDVPNEWKRVRGFDYGSTHPTASVRVAIDPDGNWFVERCYKNKEQLIEDHAKQVLSQDYGFGFIPAWGDPSGAQWFNEFQKYGLNIQPADKHVGQGSKTWVEYGVEMVNQKLKSNFGHTVRLPDGKEINDAPKLFVLDTVENQDFVKEIELLRWKTTSTGVPTPILDQNIDPNGHCDLMASLRYLVVSYRDAQGVPYQMVRRNQEAQERWRI